MCRFIASESRKNFAHIGEKSIFSEVYFINMVSVEEALAIVERSSLALEQETIGTHLAFGRFLSGDVVSRIAMPPFRQSAMDGFAVKFDSSTTSFTVIGEVAAGDCWQKALELGEAVRIYTGAMVPDSANAVVQQEWATITEKLVTFSGVLKEGLNIRPLGEQIQIGEVALRKGTRLNPGGIGFLVGLGIEEISVGTLPKISLLSTGNELVQAGKELPDGKIYESNLTMLEAAVNEQGSDCRGCHHTPDTLDETVRTLDLLIGESEITIVTGGISEGKYDFVGQALEQLGVKQLFYKVAQRPGKPLWFGKKGNKFVFGLPGNPAAALTCFYIYVLPAIRKMSGGEFYGLSRSRGKLITPYKSTEKRSEFLKVQVCNGEVHVLGSQNSSMLNSFAMANALAYIPGEVKDLNIGDEVLLYHFA